MASTVRSTTTGPWSFQNIVPNKIILLKILCTTREVVDKIFYDLLMTWYRDVTDHPIDELNSKLPLGTIINSTDTLRYFGLNLIQNQDVTVEIDAEHNLQALKRYPISRICRKQMEDHLNEIERSKVASIHRSVGWIGASASRLRAEFSSSFQQRFLEVILCYLVQKNHAIRKRKYLGTSIRFDPSAYNRAHNLSFPLSSEAGFVYRHGQMRFAARILFDEIIKKTLISIP